jgi:D-tyrosyl-tRNA(Tyr) deacylase
LSKTVGYSSGCVKKSLALPARARTANCVCGFPAVQGKIPRSEENVRAFIQRVARANVTVSGQVIGEIGNGLLILLGVGRTDNPESASYLAEKIANLRIFSDAAGKMNLSMLETGGAALVVSQFTLYGDTRGGRRPSFIQAAPPEEANRLYQEFVGALRSLGVKVETGVFQADMQVELVNDGPVTILLDSEKTI